MNFYDILLQMKTGQKVPYSKDYFDTLFAAKLADLQIKTLTGTLPLTFRTSETALRSWTIYGNNYEHNYSADHTLPLTFNTNTAGAASDWEIFGNDDIHDGQQGVGQRTVNLANSADDLNGCNINSVGAIITNNEYKLAMFQVVQGETYTLSTSDTQTVYAFYENKPVLGSQSYDSQRITTGRTFTAPITGWCAFRNVSSSSTQMAVKGSTAPISYVPYGYEIPISVNGTPQTFYIGDSPLTAGQSISKTSTGVDITAVQGANTITTDLYNKPEMSIEGVDYVGVGEKSGNDWQIPLAVTCDRNLFNIYGNMLHTGGVHTIDYNVETSSVTGEMSADSYYQLGYQNAFIKGNETFVISFDKTTAGTAELRMMNGAGSAAEIIETFDISAAKSYRVVFECEESFGDIYPRLVATEAATNTFEHLMIKKASDKGGFVPYGAKYEYNVPIDAPLTEGESVTDTLTISTFEGENTLDTTMTNKPQMSITYKGG